MKAPSVEAMRRAARFLDAAIGADGTPRDRELIEPVVTWLDDQADAAEQRSMARENNVPVAKIRALIGGGR